MRDFDSKELPNVPVACGNSENSKLSESLGLLFYYGLNLPGHVATNSTWQDDYCNPFQMRNNITEKLILSLLWQVTSWPTVFSLKADDDRMMMIMMMMMMLMSHRRSRQTEMDSGTQSVTRSPMP